MPELDVRGYLNHLISRALDEEAFAMGLGFDDAAQYHAEMDEHFDGIRSYEELDRRA
jgi:hypothetical protein